MSLTWDEVSTGEWIVAERIGGKRMIRGEVAEMGRHAVHDLMFRLKGEATDRVAKNWRLLVVEKATVVERRKDPVKVAAAHRSNVLKRAESARVRTCILGVLRVAGRPVRLTDIAPCIGRSVPAACCHLQVLQRQGKVARYGVKYQLKEACA